MFLRLVLTELKSIFVYFRVVHISVQLFSNDELAYMLCKEENLLQVRKYISIVFDSSATDNVRVVINTCFLLLAKTFVAFF